MPKLVAAMLASLLVLLSSAALAAGTPQVIAVTLDDSSGDPALHGMTLKADRSTVKAGPVVIEATNRSKDLVHEVLVVRAPAQGKALPYDTKKDRVVEMRVHPLGEVGDLEPGASGKLALDLKPGTYLLLCNQPGHYKAGMHATLVVER